MSRTVKTAATRKIRRTFGQWLADTWTALTAATVALVAGAESAWAGARLLMQAGATWYEGVGITGTLDLMMILSAVRMRRKGISEVQRKISRYAMWYGLGMSAATNVLSALVYKGIVDIAVAGPWIIVAYSPVVVVTLWFVVEMLTHESGAKHMSAAPMSSKAHKPKPDSECTPEQLARRIADRKRREVQKLEKQLTA